MAALAVAASPPVPTYSFGFCADWTLKKTAFAVFFSLASGAKPSLAISISWSSGITVSVGHFIAMSPESVSNVCTGSPSTFPPEVTPRMRAHQPFWAKALVTRDARPQAAFPHRYLPCSFPVTSSSKSNASIGFLVAERLAQQHARGGERHVAGVLAVAERTPLGVLGALEHRRELVHVVELGEALESEHLRRRAGDERCVRSRGDLRHRVQKLDVLAALAELEVPEQGPIGVAAEDVVLLLVDLAEELATVHAHRGAPCRDVPQELLLRDGQHAHLQHGSRLGVRRSGIGARSRSPRASGISRGAGSRSADPRPGGRSRRSAD